jgi:phage baseplate assembly protein gpV
MDRKAESGEALYALYTDQNPAPADSDDVAHYVMPDGSVIVWEPGKITATDIGGNTVTMTGGKIMVEGNIEIKGNLKVSGDVTVDGATDLKDTKINGVVQVAN